MISVRMGKIFVSLEYCLRELNVLNNDICSMVLHLEPKRPSAHTTKQAICARDIATFKRFRFSRKSRPFGASKPELDVIEIRAIAASCPWNLSTVPTRIVSSSFDLSNFTWALKGAMTMKSSSFISRGHRLQYNKKISSL